MDTTTEILERIDFIWNLILLPSTVILNVSAFVLILKNAGSCYNDPIVPPLLSVTGKICWKVAKSANCKLSILGLLLMDARK